MSNPSLPSESLLRQQAQWLAPARSRLLRRASVARCHRVLDLGCGCGAVTGELARRAAGQVVAVDCCRAPLRHIEGATGVSPVQGDATRLPFASGTFDLVFCQFVLMWVDARAAVKEIRRVLAPTGRLIAIEPDYEAMIEHPAEVATRELWLAGLRRAGADPAIGRRLPELLDAAGLTFRVDLLDRLEAPSPVRFDLLAELPLTPAEQHALAAARAADASLADSNAVRVAHLPVFLVSAAASPDGI